MYRSRVKSITYWCHYLHSCSQACERKGGAQRLVVEAEKDPPGVQPWSSWLCLTRILCEVLDYHIWGCLWWANRNPLRCLRWCFTRLCPKQVYKLLSGGLVFFPGGLVQHQTKIRTRPSWPSGKEGKRMRRHYMMTWGYKEYDGFMNQIKWNIVFKSRRIFKIG